MKAGHLRCCRQIWQAEAEKFQNSCESVLMKPLRALAEEAVSKFRVKVVAPTAMELYNKGTST